MADENIEQIEKQDPVESQTPTLSPVEQRASEQGWVPLDQWEGDPDDWRPAKEFVDRGELFKKIDEIKRENRNLKTALDALGKHHSQVRQVEYDRALKELKAAKKEALDEGDTAAVVEIDDKLAEVREAQKQAAAAPAVVEEQAPDQDFIAWSNRNPWYQNDRAMKAVADEVGREMVLRGRRDKMEILAEVEKAVKKEFPHKFNNPNRNKAGAVEGSTNRSSKKDDAVDMNDAEKSIMNKIVRTGVMTKEQYLKEFKAIKSRGA